ncbi:MAG: hypothetical protein E7G37_04870, partial [Streptococcus sp.]|nr:hypothetical protein [Streptococcus sp.]
VNDGKPFEENPSAQALLEESLEFLDDDEYMEVTPESIRLRKQILNKAERDKANKRKKKAAEAE